MQILKVDHFSEEHVQQQYLQYRKQVPFQKFELAENLSSQSYGQNNIFAS